MTKKEGEREKERERERETHSIKSIVDDMFKIFTHSDLSHQLVLVPVHTSQLSNVREYIL